jgi:UDP:flavonoid glycosyltransferase YjiC (YdhE family)
MHNLTAEQLREAADNVLNHHSFLKAVNIISESFQKTGGYRQAVDEIYQFKRQYDIPIQ